MDDDHVDYLHKRVLEGMGLIVLHSAHASKIFSRLMGTRTQCLRWRENDEWQRYWIVNPAHPIADGLDGEYFVIPMDETLILSSVDFSGRDFLGYRLSIPTEKVGDFDTELCEEFWLGFVRNAKCSLHLVQLAGRNSHHIIEGVFKSVARSLRTAVRKDPDAMNEIPSTKGIL